MRASAILKEAQIRTKESIAKRKTKELNSWKISKPVKVATKLSELAIGCEQAWLSSRQSRTYGAEFGE